MDTIHCRGVLFDLDGVLVDSTPAVARVWAWWARKHGFDADKVVREAHGKPSIATIRELLPNANHEVENREVERREIEDVGDVVPLPPLPGAVELLKALPLDSWAIVTSCTRKLAEVRIGTAGLSKPRHLVTSNEVTRGKPDPEPYLKGALKLGIPAAQCVVMEDAPAGIRAGKAAGAQVVALRTTAHDAELRDAGADWIVDNCAELTVEPRGNGEEFLFLRRRIKQSRTS